jgi:uncharacterized protein
MMNSINYTRALSISLPGGGQSAFLWGARKTGKSTLLQHLFPDSMWFDFLDTHLYLELSKEPWLLRERILAGINNGMVRENLPIVLDEVQKVPMVLDEVHWLIENKKVGFILCGSSARKLRRGHANLLGGRAWRFELHPLTYAEVPDFDLLRALNHGLLPSHYCAESVQKTLQAYVQDYLTEEIKAEGLVRNIASFSRFADLLGFCNGECLNFSAIARDCGVSVPTVREYFSILSDTMFGTLIDPYSPRRKRATLSSMPRFYLFDPGIAAWLSHTTIPEMRGPVFGRAFEHFIFCELRSHRDYTGLNYPIRYWRTGSGLEVDFVLGEGDIAVEVKGASSMIDKSDIRGLLSFQNDYKPKRSIVVTNESAPRTRSDGIELIPWQLFLQKLWAGEIIT